MKKKIVFAALISCILMAGFSFGEDMKQVVFVPSQEEQKDIKGNWAEESILKVMGLNLMAGYLDNTFRPHQNITKEETAVIFVRLLGEPSVSSSFAFADVKGRWSEKVIGQAVGVGLLDTSSKQFNPTAPITRGEVAMMMQRALKYKHVNFVPTTNTFVDVQNKQYSKEIQDVVALGIMGGYQNNTFKPQGTISRAELASVMLRAYELMNRAEVKVMGLGE